MGHQEHAVQVDGRTCLQSLKSISPMAERWMSPPTLLTRMSSRPKSLLRISMVLLTSVSMVASSCRE